MEFGQKCCERRVFSVNTHLVDSKENEEGYGVTIHHCKNSQVRLHQKKCLLFTFVSREEPMILSLRASSVHLFTSPRKANIFCHSSSRWGGNTSLPQPPWNTLFVGGVYGKFNHMSSAMCGRIGAIIWPRKSNTRIKKGLGGDRSDGVSRSQEESISFFEHSPWRVPRP